MIVQILREAGYEEAMLGISLSWASNVYRAKEIAPKLAHKQGGHNKFTESMMVWLDITAPRYWWQEMDTYRLATKQSGSTMHTIVKGHVSQTDFEHHISEDHIEYLNRLIDLYNIEKSSDLFLQIKANLPEGFLQRRIMCVSYKTLQNIYFQRKRHHLPEWRIFFSVLDELDHKEFIHKEFGNDSDS